MQDLPFDFITRIQFLEFKGNNSMSFKACKMKLNVHFLDFFSRKLTKDSYFLVSELGVLEEIGEL